MLPTIPQANPGVSIVIKLFATAGCVLVLTATATAQDGPVKVVLLAGQSNMAGQGRADELPAELRRAPENVRMMGQNGQLVPFEPRERFGPEVGFAHAIGRAMPDDTIVLIKHAKGGTSALAWAPKWSAAAAQQTDNQNAGPLYAQLIKQVRTLQQHHPQAEIIGMLWAQGGRDARYENAAGDYQENLTAIITAVRRDLQLPALPFVLARTPDLPTGRFPYVNQVRAAQEAVARQVPHANLIVTDDLSQHADDIHFDTQGQLEQGRRFAEALQELLPAPEAAQR